MKIYMKVKTKVILVLIMFSWGMNLFTNDNYALNDSIILKEKFQNELDILQEQYKFPGATAAYILQDGTYEVIASGLADKELEVSMKPQSRMLAASIGKTFVGAIVLALAVEGKLKLDDPISKWLGQFEWLTRVPNHETITLHQLLTHSSGIPNHIEMESFSIFFQENRDLDSNAFSPELLIEFVLDTDPVFEAGEGWYYSDTGYILIGLIIETVTGHSYYEEVTNRFLTPLHLEFTSPSDRKELTDLTAGYQSAENNFNLPSKTTDDLGVMNWNPAIEWTGGGLISNPKDLVVWAKALYEGKAIEGNYLNDLLLSVPISEDDPNTRYGIAAAIKRDTLGFTYGHSGWIPGYCSSLRYFPEFGVAISFQINTDIGIIDGSTELFNDMENRLTQIVIKSHRMKK